MTSEDGQGPVVVVTGANGLVGARVCAVLAGRGVRVRALVRRAGSAPGPDGVTEHVGDFTDPEHAAAAVAGADAVVTTVHPMGSDRQTQERVGVEGTARFAQVAVDAGVGRLVHLSTCAVYDRPAGTGDVDEDAALVGDDGRMYGVVKREADAALAEVAGLTRVLVRPPAVLGTGATSVWNTLRPTQARDDPGERRADPATAFAWVHLDDLARFVADAALGTYASATDPDVGPVAGGCTAVNLAGEPATVGDYTATVCRALGVDPVWTDDPGWTGQILTGRARAWGWSPAVDLETALAELDRDVRRLSA